MRAGVTMAGVAMLGGPSSAIAVAAAGRPARNASVTLVRDAGVLPDGSSAVDAIKLKKMVNEALFSVTGQKNLKDAWMSLLKPTDIVGLVPSAALNPTHDELTRIVTQSLMAGGVPAKNIRVADGGKGDAEACTALISLPGLKAHWLTGIGTVMKNYIMFSGHPSDYHDQNSSKLGEIWNMPHVKGKTRLVLVDALRPLCDKGPQVDPRYLWPYCGLIAGKDPVAAETIGLRILTGKRTELRGEPWPLSPPPLCVAAADEVYNLGTSRKEEIKLQQIGWSKYLLL